MKEIIAKSIVSNNTLNMYRGCTHRCIYCDSRSKVYEIGDFEDIKVKVNAVSF